MRVVEIEPGQVVVPDRYVTLKLYAAMSGRTVKSLQRKIEEGRWVEGREYHRDPDGSIAVDRHGVHAWVAGTV